MRRFIMLMIAISAIFTLGFGANKPTMDIWEVGNFIHMRVHVSQYKNVDRSVIRYDLPDIQNGKKMHEYEAYMVSYICTGDEMQIARAITIRDLQLSDELRVMLVNLKPTYTEDYDECIEYVEGYDYFNKVMDKLYNYQLK